MVLLVLLGFAILFTIFILVVVDAYKQRGFLQILLNFLVPFYSLYWLFFRLKDNRGPVIAAWVVACLLVCIPRFRHIDMGRPYDVCRLLTADQVGAELEGEPFNPGQEYGERGEGCRYTKTSAATESVLVYSYSCAVASLSQKWMGPNDYKVPDIGEEALYIDGRLYARKGLTCYSMEVEGMQPENSVEGRKNLMRRAIAAEK